jgi:hypothetical protein
MANGNSLASVSDVVVLMLEDRQYPAGPGTPA